MHKITVHNMPESNGIAERLNCTLVERTHAMLINSGLPKFLWGYTILHANSMKNHTYTKSLPNKTPYEMGHKMKPNLSDLYEWGMSVYVKIKQMDKWEV
jgi:hypothetical protein